MRKIPLRVYVFKKKKLCNNKTEMTRGRFVMCVFQMNITTHRGQLYKYELR